jgi:hypothetical protein
MLMDGLGVILFLMEIGGPIWVICSKYYGVVKYGSYGQVGQESGEIFII